MDYVSDQLFDNCMIRICAIVDNHPRESLTLMPSQHIRGLDVEMNVERIT